MNTQVRCNDNRLRQLLQATDEESADFQDARLHVDQCAACQMRLEALAAEQPWWEEAFATLSSDADENEPWDGWSPARRRQHGPMIWTDAAVRQLLSPPSHPEMLGRIGRYEVERVLGSGGMGVVFKAFDTELNRPVAIKVLAPYLAGSGAARQRFAREARAAAAVVHEHVVAIHNVESNVASNDEAPFLVMQYVAGQSLQQRLDQEGALQLCEILRIGMQTAIGLAAAHAQGLVHRDVKPSNILLEHGVDRALLSDFGLAYAADDASLTRSGYHPGTPQYMSPEQARGDAVGPRSDLFSLGSVMYAMCTGHSPFRADTSYGVLRRITDSDPRPIRQQNAAVPVWLEQMIRRLMAKLPNERFQTAQQIADLLQRCLAHIQQPTVVSLPDECRTVELPPRGARRHAAALLAAAAAVCLVVVAGFLFQANSTNPAPSSHSSPPAAGEYRNDPPTSSGDEPHLAWDAVAQQFDGFHKELGELEERSQRLWDSNSTLEQEISP